MIMEVDMPSHEAKLSKVALYLPLYDIFRLHKGLKRS